MAKRRPTTVGTNAESPASLTTPELIRQVLQADTRNVMYSEALRHLERTFLRTGTEHEPDRSLISEAVRGCIVDQDTISEALNEFYAGLSAARAEVARLLERRFASVDQRTGVRNKDSRDPKRRGPGARVDEPDAGQRDGDGRLRVVQKELVNG